MKNILFISCKNRPNYKINQSSLNSEIYNDKEVICFISKIK